MKVPEISICAVYASSNYVINYVKWYYYVILMLLIMLKKFDLDMTLLVEFDPV